jgi:hypothetical protein
LSARQGIVDPLARQLDGERAAELHSGEFAYVLRHCLLGGSELELERIARGSLMLRQIRCECGYLARGESEDEVIALLLAHVATDHPDLADTETADDIRSWIELVPN